MPIGLNVSIVDFQTSASISLNLSELDKKLLHIKEFKYPIEFLKYIS